MKTDTPKPAFTPENLFGAAYDGFSEEQRRANFVQVSMYMATLTTTLKEATEILTELHKRLRMHKHLRTYIPADTLKKLEEIVRP